MAVEATLSATNELIHQLAEVVGFTGAQVFQKLLQVQVYLALGDVTHARELAETANKIAADSIPLFLPMAQGSLALIAIQAGNLTEVDQIITANAFRDLTFNLINFLVPETAVCWYVLKLGNYDEAYTLSHKVLAYLLERNLQMYLPDFYYIQGQALLGLNRLEEARAVVAKALTILREIGGRWYFLEIARLLADLEEQSGNETTAAELRQQARTTLETIIDHIPKGELRTSFMGLPAVHAITG